MPYLSESSRPDGSCQVRPGTAKSPRGDCLLRRNLSLLQFDGGACSFELGFGVVGVGLGDVLLDRLGSAVYDGLGLGEAETGDLADRLDDVDLLVAGSSQDHGEGRLLFGSSTLFTTTGG